MVTSSLHLSEILITTMLFSRPMVHAQTTDELFTDTIDESNSTKEMPTSSNPPYATSLPSAPSVTPSTTNMASTVTDGGRVTMRQRMTTNTESKGTGNDEQTSAVLAISLAAALVAMAVITICVVIRINYKRRLTKDSWTRASKVQKGVNSETGLSNPAYDVGPTETKKRQHGSMYQRGKDVFLSFMPIDDDPSQGSKDQGGAADSIDIQAPMEAPSGTTSTNGGHQIQAIQSSIVVRHHMAIVDTDDDADSENDGYASYASFDDDDEYNHIEPEHIQSVEQE